MSTAQPNVRRGMVWGGCSSLRVCACVCAALSCYLSSSSLSPVNERDRWCTAPLHPAGSHRVTRWANGRATSTCGGDEEVSRLLRMPPARPAHHAHHHQHHHRWALGSTDAAPQRHRRRAAAHCACCCSAHERDLNTAQLSQSQLSSASPRPRPPCNAVRKCGQCRSAIGGEAALQRLSGQRLLTSEICELPLCPVCATLTSVESCRRSLERTRGSRL